MGQSLAGAGRVSKPVQASFNKWGDRPIIDCNFSTGPPGIALMARTPLHSSNLTIDTHCFKKQDRYQHGRVIQRAMWYQRLDLSQSNTLEWFAMETHNKGWEWLTRCSWRWNVSSNSSYRQRLYPRWHACQHQGWHHPEIIIQAIIIIKHLSSPTFSRQNSQAHWKRLFDDDAISKTTVDYTKQQSAALSNCTAKLFYKEPPERRMLEQVTEYSAFAFDIMLEWR